MKKIIVINGFHTGKDKFVEYAGEFASVINYSYVDFTRNMFIESGIDVREKTDKDRILFAGTNKLLEEWGDVPFKDVCFVANDFIESDLAGDILFVHIREPKVITRFVEEMSTRADVKTLLVVRDNGLVAPTEEDRNVGDYSYDCIVDNNGTFDDLKQKAETFVLSLLAEDTV